MLSQKLTLADSATTPNTVEVELTAPLGVSNPANKSQRGASSAALDEPLILSIGHESTGKGAKTVERHLVRVDMTKSVLAAGASVPSVATTSVYLVVIVPQGSVITKANVKQALEYLCNFVVSTDAEVTVLERLLNNEL